MIVFLQAGYAEKIANVWEKVAEETSVYSKDVSSNVRTAVWFV